MSDAIKTPPVMAQELAQAVVDRRFAEDAMRRAPRPIYDKSGRSMPHYAPLEKAHREAEDRIEALVLANAAHVLTWCHEMDQCPVCRGEVSV